MDLSISTVLTVLLVNAAVSLLLLANQYAERKFGLKREVTELFGLHPLSKIQSDVGGIGLIQLGFWITTPRPSWVGWVALIALTPLCTKMIVWLNLHEEGTTHIHLTRGDYLDLGYYGFNAAIVCLMGSKLLLHDLLWDTPIDKSNWLLLAGIATFISTASVARLLYYPPPPEPKVDS